MECARLRSPRGRSIRTKLQREGRTDLALLNLAIGSKLRGCDVVAVRVADMAPNGHTLERATCRQKKTGRLVRFELTEQTRQAIDNYLRMTCRKPGEFLFASRGGDDHGLTRQRPPRRPVGRVHRPRPAQVRHALPAPKQGDADLPANRQPAWVQLLLGHTKVGLCPASDYVPLRSVELICWELLLNSLNVAILLAGHF